MPPRTNGDNESLSDNTAGRPDSGAVGVNTEAREAPVEAVTNGRTESTADALRDAYNGCLNALHDFRRGRETM